MRPDRWTDNSETESGIYVFRPAEDQKESFIYTQFTHATKSGNKQFDLYFQYSCTGDIDNQRRAIVHVTLTDQGTV